MAQSKIDSLQDAVRFFMEASKAAASTYADAQVAKAKSEAAKAVMWFWVDYEKDQRKAGKAASRGASQSTPQPAPQPAQNKPEPAVDRNGTKLITTGRIQLVDVKTGSGKRGPWIRYGIMLDSEEWYTTFDKAMGEKALAAKGTNTVFELYYVKNNEGYNDLETLFQAGAQPEPQAAQNDQNNQQGDGYDDIPF